MTRKIPDSTAKDSAKSRAATVREARLKAALRANLKRRKSQERVRGESTAKSSE